MRDIALKTWTMAQFTKWLAFYRIIQSGKRIVLDRLFLVEFDEVEKCSTFREWWHLQEEEKGSE